MWVIAGLSLLCGLCLGGSTAVLSEKTISQSPNASEIQEMLDRSGLSLNTMRILLGSISAFGIVIGIVFIILAFYVRRGGVGSIITALVITAIGVFASVLGIISSLLSSGAGNPLMPACSSVILLALFVTLLILLIQSLRARGATSLEAHYQQQYWQYQQQHYAQQYGYPQQQPAPRVSPSPPPPSDSLPPPPSFDNAKKEEPPHQ